MRRSAGVVRLARWPLPTPSAKKAPCLTDPSCAQHTAISCSGTPTAPPGTGRWPGRDLSAPPTADGLVGCDNVTMQIASAQSDVRVTYRCGAAGQLVTAVVWAASATVATAGAVSVAPYVLFLGGMLILPLTSLGLRLLGGPASLPAGHPMSALAFQIAMQVPLGLLVALAAAAFDPRLFFPAAMVIVGGHYLPFVFLYGMRSFLLLAAPMIAAGVALAVAAPAWSTAGAWFTVAVLLAFSGAASAHDRRQRRAAVSR